MPPVKKKPVVEPADAAAEEVTEPAPVTFDWRGVPFSVPVSILRDARFRLALASGDLATVVYEALGADSANRLVATLQRGEDANEVLGEFFETLKASAGWGN